MGLVQETASFHSEASQGEGCVVVKEGREEDADG